jgi:hypothetical protein
MRAAAARELPLRVAPRRTHLQHLQRMGCEEIATMSFSIMDAGPVAGDYMNIAVEERFGK